MKCCDITAATLRHNVQLSHSEKTRNASGGFSNLWVPYATVRAGIKNLSGNERFNQGRINADVKRQFTIRYRADVLEADSIVVDGKRHNIKFIDNVEFRNRWLIIDTDGGVAV